MKRSDVGVELHELVSLHSFQKLILDLKQHERAPKCFQDFGTHSPIHHAFLLTSYADPFLRCRCAAIGINMVLLPIPGTSKDNALLSHQ